jgi:two-component system phosphate regulon sensor histidine kinase PhoR
MSSTRAGFVATAAAIAACAWLAARAVAAHGAAAELSAALAVALALALLAERAHARSLDRIRAALEAAQAGAPRERPLRSERGALGALARAVDAAAEQARAHAARSAAERDRLEAIFDGMVEGVLVLGADGRVQLANARVRELLDAWGELTGRSALEATRRPELADALRRAAHSEGALALEIELGEERVVEMHARRFPVAGEPQGVVAVFHDVSEIRRLESHRRDFVANVSHELRTPLASIQGFVETLHDDSLEPAQRKQYLDVVARNAERLRALIEDLLELSRIEGRTQPLALEPVDAAALASSLLRDMRPRIESRRLAVAAAGASPPALADRRALEQVLQNLLDNALKYTEPGGRIDVRLSSAGGKVRIEVADTGIGIPEADRTRVFERFYRVDKARSRDLGGTGLGLSIVKHLVQAMDGDIFLESREGHGTTVAVVLPAAARAS